LNELGYDYNSLIPSVSYSGLVSANRQSTYADGDVSSGVPVTSAFRCAYDGNMARFSHLSTMSASLVTTSQAGVRAARVASAPYVFGAGVLLTVAAAAEEGGGTRERVTVTLLESASESLATLSTTLLNGSTVIRPRFISPHGRDVLHFVRDDFDDVIDDVRRVLQLGQDRDAGLNVTIHRVHDLPSSSVGVHNSPSAAVRYVDVRLHGVHATLNVRCGATVASERARLRHRAWQRAVNAAWTVERELVQAGKLTANSWTRTQAEQLVSVGRVDGFTGEYLRDVDKHERLIDCPRNIRFVPVT